jgi:hypothetical protein
LAAVFAAAVFFDAAVFLAGAADFAGALFFVAAVVFAVAVFVAAVVFAGALFFVAAVFFAGTLFFAAAAFFVPEGVLSAVADFEVPDAAFAARPEAVAVFLVVLFFAACAVRAAISGPLASQRPPTRARQVRRG